MSSRPDVVLVAVDVRSTHNVGSLFRSCDGFGAQLLLVGICPRPMGKQNDDRLPHVAQKAHAAIAKTALGAEQSVEWEYVATLEDAVRILRKRGYTIAAIEQSVQSQALSRLNSTKKVALIVGREVEGLTTDELALCDAVYEIPMQGSKESFNVAVAAGIALYQTSLRC